MHTRIRDPRAKAGIITLASGIILFMGWDPASDPPAPQSSVSDQIVASTGPSTTPARSLETSISDGPEASTAPIASTEKSTIEITRIQEGGTALEVVAGEIMVKLAPELGLAEAQALASEFDVALLNYAEHSQIARLAVPEGETIPQFSQAVATSPLVLEAQANHIIRATGCSTNVQTHSDVQWPIDRIGADELCSAGMPETLSEIRVAVIDTGVAYGDMVVDGVEYRQAPGLADTHFEVPTGADLLTDDNAPNDDHQHGTHITSIISSQASLNGVAPNLTVLPMKVLNGDAVGTEEALIGALHLAAQHNVDIVNMSLSFEHGYRPSWAMQEAIVAAVRSGSLLIASTGNSGEAGVSFPGAFPDVIGVGATRLDRSGLCTSNPDYNDIPASYSSYGWAIDVSAPGGSVVHNRNCDIWWDAIYAETIDPDDFTRFEFYGITGTSQAAAHVSGIAAWLLAENPDLSPAEIRRILQDTAGDHIASGLGFDPHTGTGMVGALGAAVAADNGVNAAPEAYVNILPVIYDAGGDDVRGFSTVQVLSKAANGDLTPMSNIRVMGRWAGAADQQVEGVTDASGTAYFFSPAVNATENGALAPLNFIFEVQAVTEGPGSTALPVRPLGFYHLSEGMESVLTTLLDDVEDNGQTYPTGSSALFFVADPADDALGTYFDLDQLKTSYIFKTLGAAGATSPMAAALSPAFIDQNGGGLPGSQLEIELDETLLFGWGAADSVEISHVDISPTRLPSIDGITFVPLDPAFIHAAPYTTEVLNAYWDVYEGELSAFNETFSQSTLATGYASTIFGTGYASTIFGTVVDTDIWVEDDASHKLIGAGGSTDAESAGPELGSCASDGCEAPVEGE